jgi:hypothetical protein
VTENKTKIMLQILGSVQLVVEKVRSVAQEERKHNRDQITATRINGIKSIYVSYSRDGEQTELTDSTPKEAISSNIREYTIVQGSSYKWKSNHFNQGLYAVGLLSTVQHTRSKVSSSQENQTARESVPTQWLYPRITQGSATVRFLEEDVGSPVIDEKRTDKTPTVGKVQYDYVLDSNGLLLNTSFTASQLVRMEKKKISGSSPTTYIEYKRGAGIPVKPLLIRTAHEITSVLRLTVARSQQLKAMV